MRKRLTLLILAVAPVLAAAGIAVGSSAFDGAKSATARFHDVDKAREAGYSATVADKAGLTCIAQPGEGAMGIHMLKPELLFGDGTIDAANPELLVYERRNNGSMKLVALEYLVFKSEWKGAAGRRSSARSSTRSRPTTATGSRNRGRCTPGSGSRTRAGCSTRGTRGSTAARERAASSRTVSHGRGGPGRGLRVTR